MTEKRVIDWEAIEADWRAGVKTKQQMSIEYGVSRAAMDKRAKRDGWMRAVVREAVEPVAVPDEFGKAGFLYVVYLQDSGGSRYCKIGMASAFTPRFQAHQCASPFKINVACAYYVGDMRQEERALHHRFAAKRVRGEWFALDDVDIREIAARSALV